jgi:signal transduction histidine kinase
LDIVKHSKKQISENKNIPIKRNNTPNADIIIDADVSRIHQVLSNLINSSIKFIKKEGTTPVNAGKKEKRIAAATV